MKKLEAVGIFLIISFICSVNIFLVQLIFSIFTDFNNYIYTITGVGNCITLFLIYTFLSKKNKHLITAEQFRKISFKNIIYISLIGFVSSIFVSQLTSLLIYIFPSYIEISKQSSTAANSLTQLITILIIAPIYEEVVFRGIILEHIENDKNIVGSIFLQAILFGLIHGNTVQCIYASLFGIVLGLIYLECKSILGCILAHIVYNVCAVFITPQLYINQTLSFIILVIGIIVLVFEFIKRVPNYKRKYSNNI